MERNADMHQDGIEATDRIGKGSLSRRGFLTGVMAAGALTAAGLAGCAPNGQVQAEKATAQAETGSQGAQDWLGAEPTITESDIVETVDAEVVVVGAGTGGLFAACAAAEEGAKVVVLEKFISGGGIRDDLGAVNTRLQQENGTVIDKQEIITAMYHYAAGQCNPALHALWYENSGEAIDWYQDRLAERDIVLWHEGAGETHNTLYPHFPTGHSPAWPREDDALDGKTVLTDYANKLGNVTFLYETPMVKLVKEGEAVVGVIGKGKEGFVQVNASKGVIVCTGGYGRNEQMMNTLQPHTQTIYARNSAVMGTEGDGIKACLWAGAKMDETHSSMLFDRTALLPDQLGGYQNEGKMCWMGSQPWLKVNLNGERFCNESGPYDFILHAAASQPENLYCCIWDADWQAYAESFDMHGCSRMFPYPNGAPPNMPIQAAAGMIDGLIEEGYVQKADTIEELAKKLNLPADKLAATVKRTNENYANQNDPDFFKEPFRLSPVANPPFMGVRTTGYLLCTMDGIVINTDCQAIAVDGSPIEGLYVVGNDSGGYYSMTYPNLATGHACGRTVTFARITAKALASK